MSEMQLIMENWRQLQNEVEVEDLIIEINQLSKEIIDYTSLLTEQQLLSEEFLRKAAAWLGKKWKQMSGLFDQLYQKSKTLFDKMGSIRKKNRRRLYWLHGYDLFSTTKTVTKGTA